MTPVLAPTRHDGLLYLASQYTAPSKRAMHANYLAAVDATAWLLAQRIWAYSPIVHCHDIAVLHDLPRDFGFWSEYNHTIIDALNGVIVLQTPGWSYSKGIQDEINYAQQTRKRFWGLLRTTDTYQFTPAESFIHGTSPHVHTPVS